MVFVWRHFEVSALCCLKMQQIIRLNDRQLPISAITAAFANVSTKFPQWKVDIFASLPSTKNIDSWARPGLLGAWVCSVSFVQERAIKNNRSENIQGNKRKMVVRILRSSLHNKTWWWLWNFVLSPGKGGQQEAPPVKSMLMISRPKILYLSGSCILYIGQIDDDGFDS